MVIPVSGHPPFHAGTRPTLVHSAAVPAQIPWQPAQVQPQEVRQAAFQPVMHYGTVAQTSSGDPGQAAYGVAAPAGMHYVRGVKEMSGQGENGVFPRSEPMCFQYGAFCGLNIVADSRTSCVTFTGGDFTVRVQSLTHKHQSLTAFDNPLYPDNLDVPI